jgi:hypothetical protein
MLGTATDEGAGPMRDRIPMGLLAAATLAVAVAACGGGDTLTHEELVTKANEICSEPVAQAQEIVESPPDMSAGLDEQWVKELGEAAPLIQTVAQGLATLEPPSEDEDRYADLVEAYETLADTMQNAANAAETGDTALVNEQLPAAVAALAAADAAATDLGMEECARAD